MSDFFDNWTVQVRKGLLELCVLNALKGQERYGYELVKTLVAIPGLGVTEGTLYPLLSRLRVQGLITSRLEESSEGPARKYYSLTREGQETAVAMNTYLDLLTNGTDLIRKGVTNEPLDTLGKEQAGGVLRPCALRPASRRSGR
jgi:PadR family transcriptional regulator PadR